MYKLNFVEINCRMKFDYFTTGVLHMSTRYTQKSGECSFCLNLPLNIIRW